MLNDGFGELMLCFPWDVDAQHPWVPGEILSLLVCCVVISGDYAYSACNSGVLNRTEVVSVGSQVRIRSHSAVASQFLAMLEMYYQATSSCGKEPSCVPAAILLLGGAGFELFTSMERSSFHDPFLPLIFCHITV